MSSRQNGLYEFGPFRVDAAQRLLTRNGEAVTLDASGAEAQVVVGGHERAAAALFGRSLADGELPRPLDATPSEQRKASVDQMRNLVARLKRYEVWQRENR